MLSRPSLKIFGALLPAGMAVSLACGSQNATNPSSSDGGGQQDGTLGGSSGAGASSGGSGGSGGSSGGSDGSSGSGGGSSGAAAADVLQHHKSQRRDGFYTDSLMNKTLAATLKLDTAFSPTITGNVYAQPLYVTNGPGGKAAFIVATESNHVIAVDASAGSTGATLWDKTYDAPIPASGNWPLGGCGNVRPLGITGTPVVDMASRAVFFGEMTVTAANVPKHKIYAASLDDGSVKAGWPVDVETAVPGFVSTDENQRGALALVNGAVYVPYGGHIGDCNSPPYHGWVIGVNATNPTSVAAFSTGTIAADAGGGSTRGGIWASGGIASDGMSLFVTTGNTSGVTTWAGGEAVLRLDPGGAGPGPGPTFGNPGVNAFYPTAWANYDSRDIDLGGANPVVFDLPSGVKRLVAAFGKDGLVYLLNRDNLGGMGAELSATQVAPNGGSTGALNAASAVYTTSQGTYIAYRINSGRGMGCPSGGQSPTIGVVKVTPGTPPTAAVAWCSSDPGLGSPIATTTGAGDVIVWDASTRLFGYDGDTGAKVFAGGGPTDAMAVTMHRFNTPIDAGGRIVIATAAESNSGTLGGHLYVFRP